MRIFANANFDFVGRRAIAVKASVAVSAALVIGMIALQFTAGSWMNYGVDFTGGTMVQVIAPQGADAEDIREIAASVSPGATVSRFGSETEYLIRVPEFQEEGVADESIAEQIAAVLQAEYGADGLEIVRTEAVGARVGGELQRQAAIAILLSFAVTLLYLAVRFEWRYGVAAIVSTFHDILVVLGAISLFRLDVSLTTVAAVLTIIGYSLNDTIVIFDRIRENVAKLGRREAFDKIVNTALNETLPRTVLTSSTTLAALLGLYLFGGAVIREFAFILIVGVVVGTYSSIFIAAPALLAIERRWPRKQAKKSVGGGGRAKSTRVRAAV